MPPASGLARLIESSFLHSPYHQKAFAKELFSLVRPYFLWIDYATINN